MSPEKDPQNTPDLGPGLPAVEPKAPEVPQPQAPDQKPETDKIRHNYTPRTVERILSVLKSGGKRCEAYNFAGVSRSAFYEWIGEIPEFKAQVEEAEASATVYVISQLWKKIREGSSPDIRFWIERNVPGWKPAPSTVVKQTNITNMNHAETVKKARERVKSRRAAAG